MKNRKYENEVYHGLIECIDKVLGEQKNRLFEDEGDSHLHLYVELKKYFKNKYPSKVVIIILEYYVLNYDLDNKNIEKVIIDYVKEVKKNIDEIKNRHDWVIKKSYKIDIVISINNEHYLVELKYSGYRGKNYEKGTEMTKAIRSYKDDIKKIDKIVTENSRVVCGYCILLTTKDSDKYCDCLKKITEEVQLKTKGMYTYYIKRVEKQNNVRPYRT
jgi:hypothetical protein